MRQPHIQDLARTDIHSANAPARMDGRCRQYSQAEWDTPWLFPIRVELLPSGRSSTDRSLRRGLSADVPRLGSTCPKQSGPFAPTDRTMVHLRADLPPRPADTPL